MEQTERKVERNSQVPSTLRRRNLKMVLLTLITSNLFCPHAREIGKWRFYSETMQCNINTGTGTNKTSSSNLINEVKL